MKPKKALYISLMAVGAFLLLSAFPAWKLSAPAQVGGMLTGAGSGLMTMGFAQLLTLRKLEKDPSLRKQTEIDARDERNIFIRNRAKALSGDVLQWAVMAAAWISVGFGAPLWITLLAVTAFVLKCVLDVCLIVWYQREM